MIGYTVALGVGFLSSLHCTGMCGPIVLAGSLSGSSGGAPASRFRLLLGHLAYNGGRALSYGALGLLAGLLGGALGSLRLVGEYVALAGGALMVAAGILLLRPFPGLAERAARLLPGAGAVAGRARLLLSASPWSRLALGLLTPLIPCGILYAMLLEAATTQRPVTGALTMVFFALGSAPALALLGSASSLFTMRLRRRAGDLAAAAIILMGVVLLLRGLDVPYLHWLPMPGGSSSCCQH
jgi:hypothetical protein